jgi:hypothetical protein
MRRTLPARAGRWAINKLVVDRERKTQQHCTVAAPAVLSRGFEA